MVEAERKHRDTLREADTKFQDAMREAETRRINELAAQKQTFDLELAKIIRTNQVEASALLATQLKEVKTDLSERMAKQEQFRWETGGKSSGADDQWRIITGALGLVIGAGAVAVAMRKRAA